MRKYNLNPISEVAASILAGRRAGLPSPAERTARLVSHAGTSRVAQKSTLPTGRQGCTPSTAGKDACCYNPRAALDSTLEFGLKLVVALLIVGAIPCVAVANPATVVKREWHFGTDANPAPTANGAALAVHPGKLASGWLDKMPPLMGGAAGIWDLGGAGTITCDLSAALGGNAQRVTVRVSQWWNGGIFDLLDVQVPGVQAAPKAPDISNVGNFGSWVVDETTFTAVPGGELGSLILTAGNKGSLVNSVEIEAVLAPVAPVVPLQLSIQLTSNGDLELSWPEAAGAAVIESNGDLSDPEGWTALAGATQVVNGRYTLTVPASGAGQSFRLKQ